MNTDYHVAIVQTTNNHFRVFVKCWSSASVSCVQHPQTLVSRCNSLDCESTIWLSCLMENIDSLYP